MSAGQKIIEGLQQAIAGDFARVTVAGHMWVRLDRTDTLESFVREIVRDELRRAGLINDDTHDSR